MQPTLRLYEDDSMRRECTALVSAVEDGTVILDRTVAYPSGGGQEGDSGWLVDDNDNRWRFAVAVNLPGRLRVAHPLVASGDDAQGPPAIGSSLRVEIDWQVRYQRMRLHTALHVLCAVVEAPVTGCAIGDDTARLDFDLPEVRFTKEDIAAAIAEHIAADHAVSARYISVDEFRAMPELVRTTAVAPPQMPGGVRIVSIGDIDKQACGGTHVGSTGEIGAISVEKIKKKSRLNRRISIALA